MQGRVSKVQALMATWMPSTGTRSAGRCTAAGNDIHTVSDITGWPLSAVTLLGVPKSKAAMTESKHPDEMSDAELAEHHWQHREDELGEEVDFEIVKPLRVG